MTSQLTSLYTSINENFPVAGQDNDTQVFRDNFDTIKQSIRKAGEELTDLQLHSARTDAETNFNENYISNAVLRSTRQSAYDGGAITVPISIDFGNGHYQKIRFGASIVLGFLEFPSNITTPAGVGKVTLELYSDGTDRTITLDPSNNITYKKRNWPSTPGGNAFNVTSSSNPIIIEVWKYSNDVMFVNYIGAFE